ncbi:HsdM family class I SAM-dependent methyltransferase [Rhodopirellula sp. JC639]|uniref:class I SAM-dependent DNA methyltransferase n=1 Tax=Stieleria mannarensis TaxID=2755585 RepID=UPI001603C525|nr:class I SAM-dependent DNA methyltransferase [Rhodopirellula sp. JC639]
MITGPLKSKIDRLWLEFHSGGITNPLTVIEQITYLMFLRLLDIAEMRNEKKAARSKKPFNRVFSDGESTGPDKGNSGKDKKQKPRPSEQHLRWHRLRAMKGEALLELMRKPKTEDDPVGGVFEHLKGISGEQSTFGQFMKDAQFMIVKPQLLVKAMELIEELPLDRGDTKGDLYEYMLGKLTTAGINGQFRTPRHIIRMMVELVDPSPDWKICDPACGTGGFLVYAMEYLQKKYTSAEGIDREEIKNEDGTTTINEIYTGDLLEQYREHIKDEMFHGYDFEATMLRIAAMNMMLHGVENPDIQNRDTLSNRFVEERPQVSKDYFDLILANPPFKGSLDAELVHKSLTSAVKTKKTELLFPALMLRMLKNGGRCAVIVPDGVLFGSSTAHKKLRSTIIDDHQLDAIIKLPSGVFKPYAGVATAIMIFTKAGQTQDVFFYDVEHDGFSLDDKRQPVKDNDLPDAVTQWRKWDNGKGKKHFTNRAKKAFSVSADEIRKEKYDLSIGRYKEVPYEEPVYDKPTAILKRLAKMESSIASDLKELEGLLK